MERTKAIERMRGICSRKECCRQEISAKLEKLEVEDVKGAVEQLCIEGFIDERRYARAFARDKSSLQGWGSLKIKLALQRKGIDPEELPHIWEQYYTSRQRGNKGVSGLGLPIVKQISALHHAEVSAESEPGAGSTFRFEI